MHSLSFLLPNTNKYKSILFIYLLVTIFLIGVVIMYLNSDYHYSKLLMEAIEDGDTDEVLDIVQKKPNCMNTYPTVIPDLFQDLMDKCIHYPLVKACEKGDIEIVRIMVENGADVNLGATYMPLSITYRKKPYNWYDISMYLIENGASLDYEANIPGESILTDIVQNAPGERSEKTEEVEAAFFYVLNNCDYEKIDLMRVLQHCTTFDRHKIVQYLLDNDYCQVNDIIGNGYTALMFAARDSDVEMIKLLLEYGADKTIKDNEGKTAYDYAVKKNKSDIIALLKE